MKNNYKLQYKGFINTPALWLNNSISNLHQFEHSTTHFEINTPEKFSEIRLGKRVEQFLNFQIENTTNCKIIAENLQIRDGKQTIGELDAIISKNENSIHIETVYKFYLYDTSIQSENELDKWIGPNQKDTFTYKLNKLVEKQLPLLFHFETKKHLEDLNINLKNTQQNVCFKAQLFLPFQKQNLNVYPFNAKAIYGFYLSIIHFEELKGFQFYIPLKLDWLTQPNDSAEWLNFNATAKKLNVFISEKRSPMLWLKSNTNQLLKCFITWW